MKKNRVKVSVTMPAYNAEKFIASSIESVLGQDYPHFELVILDDGSTDRTFNIISSFHKDPRVRIYRQKNRGIGYTRQKLETLAKGIYIAPHDDDDIMLPGKLKIQAEFLDKHLRIDLVYGKAMFIDKTGRRIKASQMSSVVGPQFGKDINKTWDLLFGTIPFGSCMYRKVLLQKVGGYDKDLKIAADLDIFLKLAEITNFRFLDIFFYKYRWHKNNVSKNKVLMKKEVDLVKKRAILRRYAKDNTLSLNW